MDIQNKNLGLVSFGIENDALGMADGTQVVSLGDSGVAVLTFDVPIRNGLGPDFAVFENGFTDGYMEFAFVEVSSDGLNFVRFPATSEIQTDTQRDNFSIVDCRYVHNLAGKYRANYGTPFDLDDLLGNPMLDMESITHVKLIDVIGSIDPSVGSFDAQGTLINDPYPTAFESGGFDLDAVAVLNQGAMGLQPLDKVFNVFPNPFENTLSIQFDDSFIYEILDINGKIMSRGSGKGLVILNGEEWKSGCYFVHIFNEVMNQQKIVLK